MDGFQDDLEHPKKRRRREYRAPVSARLIPDEELRGTACVVSEDLWIDLSGHAVSALGKS